MEKNLPDVTGLDMTQFFMWMSLDVPLQACHGEKKNEMSHRGKALRAMKEKALMGKGLS